MRVMKWSMIALAVSASTSQFAMASSQEESKGFFEDQSLNVLSRMLYMNRDWKNNDSDEQSYREEAGLGVRAIYESGFTQGTVGVGVDAFALGSVRFDGGTGRAGNGLFAQDSSDNLEKTQSKAGGAVKFRLSDTVLKYGNQFTSSPVFATDDSRLLPEVATGTLITSNEIEGLELNAGRFTADSGMPSSSRDTYNAQIDGTLKSIDVIGGTYGFSDNLSASLYYADNEDVA